MKYLDFELYDKLCAMEPQEDDVKRWDEQDELWLKEFKRIRHRFPSKFVKEFSKCHFHDYRATNIQILPDSKKGNSLKIELDHRGSSHHMFFTNVNNVKMDFFEEKTSIMDWLVCEIYEVTSKRNGISILFNNGTLSFEFDKIRYSNKITQGMSR